jgi:serine/threonine protein kinase
MSGVCRATDTGRDREWAIKILPDTVAQHPDRLVCFEREAKVLASLNHPNVAVLLRPAGYPGFNTRYGLISRIGRKCWSRAFRSKRRALQFGFLECGPIRMFELSTLDGASTRWRPGP